ncbi:MAG: DMT family transporter [Alphaproteobacteria bacterium]
MAGPSPPNNPALGIICIVLGMTAITVNDMLIKLLSDGYPLHQMVFLRSIIAVAFSLGMVQLEGGWKILRTDKPVWHLARGLLLAVSNLSFFAALAVLPLADATALFFVAPLFITLLSIPILGEKVGVRRISAVLVGFAGVLVMQRPWESGVSDKLVMLLPVLAAFTYALCQILARRLGASAKASAMAAYIQGIFIVVSIGFYVVAGDGRFAAGVENESLRFLLKPWRWPDSNDGLLFLFLGLLSAVIGYSISQAYRLAPPATIAPFEYVAMPLAVLWGWLVWDYLPSMQILGGIVLIMGAGLYVFVRERKRGQEHGYQ